MELLLNRYQQNVDWLGTLAQDGVQKYYTLDPGDVPPGVYSVTKYFSPDHGYNVLLLNDVPGHAYIEMHVGNYPADSKGCILVGMSVGGADYIQDSQVAVDQLYNDTFAVLDAGGVVNLTITENGTAQSGAVAAVADNSGVVLPIIAGAAIIGIAIAVLV